MRRVTCFMILAVIVFPGALAFSATYYLTAAGAGSAQTPGSWNAVPEGGGTAATNFTRRDTFIIPAGINGVVTGNWYFGNGEQRQNTILIVNGSLTLNSGFTLTLLQRTVGRSNGTAKVTVNGSWVFLGTNANQLVATLSGGASAQITFTLSSGAALKTANANGITGTNASINTANMTLSLSQSANYEFNGAGQNMSGLPVTVNKLSVAGTGTKNIMVNTTVTDSLKIMDSGSILDIAGYTISVGTWANSGTVKFSGLTNGQAISGGTVEYYGAAQTVASGTYNNLTVSGSGIKALAGNTTVNGTLTASGSVLDTGAYTLTVDSKTQRSLYQAWANGWLEQPQTYDGFEFVIIEPDAADSIGAWDGFYVSVKQGLNVHFLSNPGASAAPATASKSFAPNTWYMISSPLDPGGERDARASLSGSEFPDEEYGEKWGIYKWNNELGEIGAFHHHSDGNFATLTPGRGFWLRHIYGESKNVAVSGSGVTTTDGFYKLKLPLDAGHDNTWHQIGNPYSYPVKWSDVKFSDPLDAGFALGKTAVSLSQENVATSYIRLALFSTECTARDTYNRAGIVLSTGADYNIYNVTKPTAPDAKVSLSMTDPSNPDRRALAYDYRNAEEDVYTWEVSLSTTLESIEAVLSVKEFTNVPSGVIFTLKHPVTGDAYTLGGDDDIPLILTSSAKKTLILTASIPYIETSTEFRGPVVEIIGVYPNPFNPTTTVNFDLNVTGSVRVNIYNENGQFVETLVNKYLTAGSHKTTWNASWYSTGVYIVVVESGGSRVSRTITLMK